MTKRGTLAKAVERFERASKKTRGESDLYRAAVECLAKIPHFHWTGIYLLRGDMLELDNFIGRPTEHVKIPVGKGICGSAVSRNANVIVEDVARESNYLACSIETRSEIVVLIRDGDEVVGEIDVDSDEPGAFDGEDERALESVAGIIVQRLREMRNGPGRKGKEGQTVPVRR